MVRVPRSTAVMMLVIVLPSARLLYTRKQPSGELGLALLLVGVKLRGHHAQVTLHECNLQERYGLRTWERPKPWSPKRWTTKA
jgi:hypothetical protein